MLQTQFLSCPRADWPVMRNKRPLHFSSLHYKHADVHVVVERISERRPDPIHLNCVSALPWENK